MTFEQAIRKAIKAYWKENSDFSDMSSFKDKKYNKEYFNGVETEFLTPKDKKEDKRFIK